MSESTAPANGATTETTEGAPAPGQPTDLTEALAERDQRIEALEGRLRRDEVTRTVREALDGTDLTQSARTSIAETIAAAPVPTTDAGEVDVEAVREAVDTEAKRIRAMVAEMAGGGHVAGMGGGDPLDETDDEGVKKLTEAYVSRGFSREDAEFMASL